ncbi:MAG: EamA family transporter [Rhodospirillales bacterium]|nr:EamA family transporter [Rhodospirillales bacterium]
MVKSGGDPWLRMGTTIATAGVIGLAFTPFFELPDRAAWPYIAISIAIHQVYFVSVCLGYRFGDLSQVYPIQRGIAPLLVAVGGYYFANEYLNTQGMIAVALISLAILSLALGSNLRLTAGPAVPIALFTGALIAAYTVVDGLGGRLAGDIFGYIAWLSALEALPFSLLVLWMVRRKPRAANRRHILTGIGGGALAFLAYGLVIWAMSLTHLTYVSALRETSVILAAWMGSRLLGEPFGRYRIIAASLVAAGVLMLQISEAG